MFKFTKKKEEIVTSVNTNVVEGSEVWMVSWNARYGEYYGNIKRTAKAFLTEENAKAFANSLRMAQELLQYTEDIEIKIEKQN